MGALVSSAVPRLRCPEEANVRAPGERRLAAPRLHPRRRRADRDEHVRRQPAQARRPLPRGRARPRSTRPASSSPARRARSPGATSSSPARSARSATSSARRDEPRRALRRAGADPRGPRRRPVHGRDVLRPRRARGARSRRCASVSSLPIVALLTFDEDAETLARRVGAGEAAERLRRARRRRRSARTTAPGPHGRADRARARWAATASPLAALPNIGLASLAGGARHLPARDAGVLRRVRGAGAQPRRRASIGGCCGTTPAQIAAIRARARARSAGPRRRFVFGERELAVALPTAARGDGARARSSATGEFVVSVQLDPPLGGDNAGAARGPRRARASPGSVDFVDINDNATARARMSALMASVAIERASASRRSRTSRRATRRSMGLESLLLGAHAEGVRNILAVTGDPPEVGDYPGSRGVYEVDAIGLTQLIAHLNRGEDYNGQPIDAPTSFFVGVAVNPTADDLELELDRFRRKVEAGAQFAMTQILFDLAYLDDFRERIGGTSPIPLLVGILPLSSYRLALRLHNEVPGIVVPEHVQEGLRDAGPDATAVGRELARELIAEAARARPPASTSSRRSGGRSARSTCSASARSRRSRPARPRRRARGARARAGRRSRPSEPIRAAKTVVSTRPRALTAGPPELPCRTRPPRLVIVRVTGPSAVGVVGDDGRRAADAAGRGGERAVVRDSRGSRPRVPGSASARRSGGTPSGPRRAARRRRCAGRTRPRGVRKRSPPDARPSCSSWPATTCAAVTTRPRRATQPLPETDEPARDAEDAHDARRRRAHARPAEQPRVGRVDRARAGRRSPGTGRRARSPPAAAPAGRSRSAAGARSTAARSRRSSVWPGRWSATAPSTQTIASPAAAPTASPPSESSARSGGSTPQRAPDRVAGHRSRPSRARARRPPRRRARRAACTASRRRRAELRREARPEHRPDGDPHERERAPDKPLPQPEQRRQRDEAERDPVASGCIGQER